MSLSLSRGVGSYCEERSVGAGILNPSFNKSIWGWSSVCRAPCFIGSSFKSVLCMFCLFPGFKWLLSALRSADQALGDLANNQLGFGSCRLAQCARADEESLLLWTYEQAAHCSSGAREFFNPLLLTKGESQCLCPHSHCWEDPSFWPHRPVTGVPPD